MLRVHKVRLDPNNAQSTHFAKACGTARFAYNWALAEWKRQYDAHRADPSSPKPSEGALRRQLNSVKRERFPWMLEVTKCAPQEAIIALGGAFRNYFEGRARYPQFKKKGLHDAFRISQGFFNVEGSRIRIPNLGWVRMREPLRFDGRLVSVAISRTAGRWFAAIAVETDQLPAKSESQAEVGVDLGVKDLAVLSTGEKIAGPKALSTLLARLRRLSRAHSRKQKGSANRKRSAARLAALHYRISCVRGDALHKLSDALTMRFGWIAIEDLNVKGMMANRQLARHIADASFGELRRQLAYKTEQRGVRLEIIDRWAPTSKTCSACGNVNDALTLSDRTWVCGSCGTFHDRDVNAAKNILAVSYTVSARGEEGSGQRRKAKAKPASTKRESNSKQAQATERVCVSFE
jgi:putative transposase